MTESEIVAAEVMCKLLSVRPVDESTLTVNSILVSNKENSKKKKREPKKISKRPHQIISFPLNPSYGFIMVPNTDICYTYPKTMINSMGHSDNQLFKAAMLSLCSPDVELICEYNGEQNPFGPNHRHFSGVNSVIGFYIAIMSAAPDAVFEFLEPIKVFRNSETKMTFITYKIAMSQTRTKVLVDHINTTSSNPSEPLNSGNNINKKMCREDTSTSTSTSIYATTADSNSSSRDTITSLSTSTEIAPNTLDMPTYTFSSANNRIEHSLDNSYNSSDDASGICSSDASGRAPSNTIPSKLPVTVNTNSTDSPVTSLTSSFQTNVTFSLAPITTTPIVHNYHIGAYYCDVNEEMKIVRICNLFHVTSERPVAREKAKRVYLK